MIRNANRAEHEPVRGARASAPKVHEACGAGRR